MFSLNSANSVIKIFVITVKGFEPPTSCVRNQGATTAPTWHMPETESLNWFQFILQWFIRFLKFDEFTEFLFYLGKTPLLLPPTTKLGQGYIFTGVCDSVHRGASASVHAGIPHPPSRHPPQTRHPPRPGTLPRPGTPLEQAPPGAEHARRYGQRAGGTHPTGMQSCSCERLSLESVEPISGWFYFNSCTIWTPS